MSPRADLIERGAVIPAVAWVLAEVFTLVLNLVVALLIAVNARGRPIMETALAIMQRWAKRLAILGDKGSGGRQCDDGVLRSASLPSHGNGYRLGRPQVRILLNDQPLGPEILHALQVLTKGLTIEIEGVHAGALCLGRMAQGRPT